MLVSFCIQLICIDMRWNGKSKWIVKINTNSNLLYTQIDFLFLQVVIRQNTKLFNEKDSTYNIFEQRIITREHFLRPRTNVKTLPGYDQHFQNYKVYLTITYFFNSTQYRKYRSNPTCKLNIQFVMYAFLKPIYKDVLGLGAL